MAAFVLYREAALLLAQSVVSASARAPEADSLEAAAVLNRLDEELERTKREPPPELARQRPRLASPRRLLADELDAAQVTVTLEELERVTDWLWVLSGPRSWRRPWVSLGLPLLAAALVVLASASVIWVRVQPPDNLALNALVESSSDAWGTTPAGAVDGFRYGQLGFHSDLESEPWLSIDLGRPYALTRVEAYGRGDCCYDQSLPLAFEVSEDGVSYAHVAKRSRRFSQYEPWVIRPRSRVARFVRFRVVRPDSYLVLGEVEVYGREASAGPTSD